MTYYGIFRANRKVNLAFQRFEHASLRLVTCFKNFDKEYILYEQEVGVRVEFEKTKIFL